MKYTAEQRLIIYTALLWELENTFIVFGMCNILLKMGVLYTLSKYPELYSQRPDAVGPHWWTKGDTAPRILAVQKAIELVNNKLPSWKP